MSFPPPDNPDWYRQTQFAGNPLLEVTNADIPSCPSGGGDLSDIMAAASVPEPLYVGNWPAIGLAVDMGSGFDTYIGWYFQVAWSPTPNAGDQFAIEQYYGDQGCIISDTLPVLAPYAWFYWGSVAGDQPDGGQLRVFGSLATSRGAPNNTGGILTGFQVPGGALLGVPEFAMPSGPEVDYYSAILSPGWHWLFIESDTIADAGVSMDLPIEQVSTFTVANAAPLTDFRFFQGSVLIPNIQPRMRFVNTSGADVNMSGSLLRAKV